MVGMADSQKLSVIPIKINDGPLELPSWMRDTQYVRGWEYKTIEQLVDKIIASYDAGVARARPVISL